MSKFINNTILIILLLVSNTLFAEIESVDIFNGEFQHILKIQEEPKISKFNKLWKTKKEMKVKIKINWALGYRLYLRGDSDSGLWLCYDGWLMPLSAKTKSGLYKLESNSNFEALFSPTHNKPFQPTAYTAG